ncbi:MAG: AbrB/MazE/SpoVT family DNA-binding domain-containing protein [Candidatus Gracilibacteria bacterium]
MQEKLCDIKLYGTTNIGPKGQIVIPKEIRDKLNLNPGDSITILLKDDKYVGLVKNQDVRELIEYVNSMESN